MRKNLLILLLCAPLLYIAVSEGMRLYSVSTWSSPKLEVSEEDAPPKPEVLATARKTADAIVDLPDGVTGRGRPGRATAPGSPQEPPLGSVVAAYAKKRADRAFEVEKAKQEGADAEKEIEEILRKMRGTEGWPTVVNPELDGQLEEYMRNVYNPDVVASARAEAAWPARQENFPRGALERQYAAIDKWSPDKSGTKKIDRTTFDSHASSYRDFLREHGSAKGSFAVRLTGEAKERLDLAQRGDRLVDIINDSLAPNDSITKATDVEREKRSIAAIAAIVKLDDDNAPRLVRGALRHVVHVLCDDFLKPEPLDEYVNLSSTDASRC